MQLIKFYAYIWPLVGIIILLSCNILLSIVAVMMCKRYYQRFLESITINAKLESLIGLHETRSADIGPLFPDDKNYLPERWLNDRKNQKANEFVKSRMKRGANMFVRIAFWILLGINVLFILGLVFRIINLASQYYYWYFPCCHFDCY